MFEAWNWLFANPMKFVQTVIGLYIVVNPAGASSVFMGLTQDTDRPHRFAIALRACISGFVILAVFGFAGKDLFEFLHIHPWALQIAGGIIMFAFAFALVRGREKEFFGSGEMDGETKARLDIAYYPLAVPLLASPASITLVITQSAAGADTPPRMIIIFGIAFICGVAFLNMLRLGIRIEKKGPGIGLILPRFWGLLLAILSVQFIYDGVLAVIPKIAHAWNSGVTPLPPN